MNGDFRVGNWVVRPQRLCICVNGEDVHIKPKSMAVLECLARAEGRVVSRNDILDAVWPGADVTDDVLTHSVTELRKAFGDSPRDPSVIETIPKKGLRLMREVAWIDDSTKQHGDEDVTVPDRSAPNMLRYALLSAAIVLIVLAGWQLLPGRDTGVRQSEPRSIAVLPFDDISQEQDLQYLADGLSEELTHNLSFLEGLQVVGSGSIALFADGSGDHRAIAEKLGCNFVLDGSVRRSADKLRISARLIDAEKGIQLWSHVFDRPYADILEIQREIAAAVAKALSVELGVGRAETGIGSTSNVAAFEQVLRGDSYFDLTPGGLDKALSHYRKAVELDPDYALAWMRIAWYYGAIQFAVEGSDKEEYQRLAEAAIARALELAPESEYVLMSASFVMFMREDWFEARRLYDRATAINARRANSLFPDASSMEVHVNMLLKLGYVDEQVRLLERVSQGQRLGDVYAHFLPQAYLSAGRIEEALDELELVFPELRAGYNVCHVGVSVALTLDDPALIRLWSQRVLDSGVSEQREIAITTMLDLLGDREAALGWLRDEYESKSGFDDIQLVWAGYYGDNELVLKAMRRSMDLWFFWMPLMANARKTEEFKAIVRDKGLVDYWREFGWNDFCKPIGEYDFECR